MRLSIPGRARGYLLMEMLLASAVVAVSLLVAVDHIASARVVVTHASHRQVAVTLARAKCEEIMSALPTTTADGALQSVGSSYPALKWSWSSVVQTMQSGADAGIGQTSGYLVTCNVQFPTERGSLEDRAFTPATDERGQVTVQQLWFPSPLTY